MMACLPVFHHLESDFEGQSGTLLHRLETSRWALVFPFLPPFQFLLLTQNLWVFCDPETSDLPHGGLIHTFLDDRKTSDFSNVLYHLEDSYRISAINAVGTCSQHQTSFSDFPKAIPSRLRSPAAIFSTTGVFPFHRFADFHAFSGSTCI